MQLSECSLCDNQNEPAAAFTFRAARDVLFALLDGEATLFCETTQKVYALNPVAALIWCCLEAENDPLAAQTRLVEAGVDRTAAATHIADAVHSWLQLGLVSADFHPVQERHARAFRIGGRSFTVETSSQFLSRQIAALFDPHASGVADTAASRIKVIEIEGSLHVFFDERKYASCTHDELLPTIKALVTEQIVNQIRPEIAVHAACLSQRGRCLLVSGEPGAGKTTLALQLAAKGFGFGGDDIALISPDGSARGVPFAPAVKSGAWEIVGQIRPELQNLPVYRRPDGMRVKYVAPGDADEAPYPVGWIFFLRREAGGAIEFAPVGAVEAMRRLLAGAYSPDGRLSLDGFGALRRLLAGAKAFELTYFSSAEAADAISAFCHDHA